MSGTIYPFFNIVSLVTIIICGCNSTRVIDSSVLKLRRDFCEPAPAERFIFPNISPQVAPRSLQEDSILAGFLSAQDSIIANATGTVPLILSLLTHARDSSLNGKLLFQISSNKIHEKIQSIRIAMDALLAELDCEATRTREISSYLAKLSKRTNSMVIAASITAGAVTTIAPVFITGKSAQNGIAVGTGSLSVALAVISLHPFAKKVKLFHYRNLLSDIWYQPRYSTIYRPEIWYLLTNDQLSNIKCVSRAQIVKTRWLKFYLDNNLDQPTEKLLFQNGGIYDTGNLDLRASMLNELQFSIRSINQNFQHFITTIESVQANGWK
ncbi:MAG: hypothetical protein ABIU63_08350 [Chitinophagaceae bacterium]